MILRVETAFRLLRRVFSRTFWIARLLGLERDINAVGNQRGLVLVQIDGLGMEELKKAIQSGEAPFLSRLLIDEHYSLKSLYSGLPSSTPAVQAELFYGVKSAVPGFSFIDKQTGELRKMYEPESALAKQSLIQSQGEPLLSNGSAYCNIYTGGAEDAHFCASAMGWGELFSGSRAFVWLIACVLYAGLLVRVVVLTLLELILACVDVIRGFLSGKNLHAEVKFVVSRVAISILLRDLITIGAKLDIARGLPIIHLNYLGYDEQAHRRGPSSRFAHWALKGIDRNIQRLWISCHQARHRHYDLWVYSDHGQEATIPYERLTGYSIKQSIYRVLLAVCPQAANGLHVDNDRIGQRRFSLIGGRYRQQIMPAQTENEQLPCVTGNSSSVKVVAMGPVGHVYLEPALNNVEIFQQLAERLVKDEQVPGVLYLGANGRACVRVLESVLDLRTDFTQLLGADHPCRLDIVEDLDSMIRHVDAGQLILLGWVAGSRAVSFPIENGAHAGIGPRETHAFLLMPSDILPLQLPERNLRPLDLRNSVQSFLKQSTAEFDRNRVVQPDLESVPPGHLRVMSYNVHSCVGMDSKVAPERIARVIARYRPDVVALQELDMGKRRTLHVHQAERIAELLNMKYDFHCAMQVDEEEYGDAILTHLPIRNSRKGLLGTRLTRYGSEPRGVQWLTLDFGGVDVQVFNTHLGLYSAERRQQVELLLSDQWLSHDECRGPVIVCGDFNATPNSPAMRRLALHLDDVQSLVSGARLSTFPARMPAMCIDHILVRGVESVAGVKVPGTELTRLASDHLPILVDVNPAGRMQNTKPPVTESAL